MKTEQTSLLIGIASIIIGIAALVNEEYRMYIVSLYPLFLIVYLFSSYINKIEKNEKEIEEIKRKLKIGERLNRLELKVFKK